MKKTDSLKYIPSTNKKFTMAEVAQMSMYTLPSETHETPKIRKTREVYMKSLRLKIKQYLLTHPEQNWMYIDDVPVEYLKIDMEYQRDLDINKVNAIIAEFDKNRIIIKKGSLRDDDYIYIFEGQHLALAMILMGYKNICLMVYLGLEFKDECFLFAVQSDNSSDPNWSYKFKDLAKAGFHPYDIMMKHLNAHNITVLCRAERGYSTIRNIAAAKCLIDMWKAAQEEGLEFALQLFEDCKWDNRRWTYSRINLCMAIAAYQTITDEQEYDDFVRYLSLTNSQEYQGEAKRYSEYIKLEGASRHPEKMIRQYTIDLILDKIPEDF